MKKSALILLAALLLSSCGQTENAKMSETLPTSGTSAVTETSITTEQETETTTVPQTTAQTTIETTAETEPEVPLTPLEQMYKYREDCGSEFLLYDFTGDNFPETVEIWGAEWGSDYCIRDFYGNTCCLVYGGDLAYDKIYVCSDGEHKYIVSYGITGMSGCTWRYAKRFDFYENGEITERTIGYADNFWRWSDSKRCNTEFYFEDSVVSPIGFYSHEYEDRETQFAKDTIDEMFEAEFKKYLSGCNIIDEISFGFDEINFRWVIESTSQQPDFAEYPAENADIPDKSVEEIALGKISYPIDSTSVVINSDYIPDDFDFNVLDRFENLKCVDFYAVSPESFEKRYTIKPSEWCKRLETLTIDPFVFSVEGGLGCFENVTDLQLMVDSGPIDDLSFLKDMPNIKVLRPYFSVTDKEVYRTLTELPNLQVIADSEMWPTFERSHIPKEEIPDVMTEMFADYLWVLLK